MAVPPAAAIIAAVSSMVSGRAYGDGWPVTLRPVQYTIAPASPSARATPRPAPRVAPATTATCPSSGFISRPGEWLCAGDEGFGDRARRARRHHAAGFLI